MKDIMTDLQNTILKFILNEDIDWGTLILLVIIAALVLAAMLVAISIKNRAKEQVGSLKNIEDHLSKIDLGDIESNDDATKNECTCDGKSPAKEEQDLLAAVSEAIRAKDGERCEETQASIVREYNIGKSGKIYTKEELKEQIKV